MAAKYQLKKLSNIKDMIGFIYLSAPNSFPKVGVFTDDHKNNLSIAFQRLEDAFPLVEKKIKSPEQLAKLRKMLSDALDGRFQVSTATQG
jgi:hypothetical protein